MNSEARVANREVVKREELSAQPSTVLARVAAVAQGLPVPSDPDRETTPEIEIPPRFRATMEHLTRHHPELVKRRYEEFLASELSDTNVVQEGDQVKL